MSVNCTTVWKDITIISSRELPLFNFVRLDILCAWIGPPSEKLWPFEFLESFRCSISSISICEAPESDLRMKSYDHLNFSRPSVVQFRASRWFISPNRTSVWNVMTIGISRALSLFNFKRLDELRPRNGHLCEKLWHSNFSRAFVVQFGASRYIKSPNRTSVWNVITIRISRELPLFNFERLDIFCARIGPPSEKLWLFDILESFRCSI